MPTPDSIDRAPSPSSSGVPLGPPRPDMVVFINPTTRQVVTVQGNSPSQIAMLLAQGYERHVVPGASWGDFSKAVGTNLTTIAADGSVVPTAPFSGLTPEQQAQIDATYQGINDQANSAQDNLVKAYQIAQPARDRAALVAKENYGASVIPTQAAAAFSGAGYAQANHQLYQGRLERDRTLAGLADQQTADQFQFQVSQQQTERQRQQALQQAYTDALGRVQSMFNNGVDSALSWLR